MAIRNPSFTSTRAKLVYPSKRCIAKGISDDGGLFIRDDYDGFVFSKEDINLNYGDLAYKVFSFFLTDFNKEELEDVVNKAYRSGNFPSNPIGVKSFDDVSFLELYHGPTFAFKDMALTVLPHLLSYSREFILNKRKPVILTATSGDTGGAALSGFFNALDTEVVVLYPTDGVSAFQEKQMHFYENEHCRVFAIEGNFDDCQTLVKKVFGSNLELEHYALSSANSINIGRLIPQVVYYFASYLELVKTNKIAFGEKVNFVVPTGNFGNILACYIAKRMGLYINKIVCASNENNVLTDFFETGIYDKNRLFHVTDSPAMDILVSSNLERLIYLSSNCNETLTASYMKELKEKGRYQVSQEILDNLSDFIGVYIDNDKTIEGIRDCYKDRHYLIDPHTSVAYCGYLKKKEELEGYSVVVSTASPYKFLSAMAKAFDIKGSDEEIVNELNKKSDYKSPSLLEEIMNHDFKKEVWKKEEMEEKLLSLLRRIDAKG